MTIDAIISEKIRVQNFHLPLRTMTKAVSEYVLRQKDVRDLTR